MNQSKRLTTAIGLILGVGTLFSECQSFTIPNNNIIQTQSNQLSSSTLFVSPKTSFRSKGSSSSPNNDNNNNNNNASNQNDKNHQNNNTGNTHNGKHFNLNVNIPIAHNKENSLHHNNHGSNNGSITNNSNNHNHNRNPLHHHLQQRKQHLVFDTDHSYTTLHHHNQKIGNPNINDDDEQIGSSKKDDEQQQIISSNTQSQQPKAQSPSSTSSQQQQQQNRVSKFLSQIIPQQNYKLVSDTPEWKKLVKHAEYIQSTHLRDLLQDKKRCDELYATHDGVYFDYSRQRITLETMDMLLELAERQNLKERIDAMVNGEKINFTEDRAVLHTALRGKRPNENDKDSKNRIIVDGDDVMEEVYDVLDQIKYFTEAVRSGEIRGFTGKRLRNIISVGIGGSYLGPEFLHECLKTEPEGVTKSLGYTLRFLSNVDPVDVERACADLDPEETLVVIVSKTFTTAETMLNARTVRQWLWDFMGDDREVVRKHVVAVSSISSKDKVEAFGIDTEKYFFRFWDWVGGRYSVCSAVGGIPISLLYGYDLFEKFLQVSDYSEMDACMDTIIS